MLAELHECMYVHTYTYIQNAIPGNIFQRKNTYVIIDVKEQIHLSNDNIYDYCLTIKRH